MVGPTHGNDDRQPTSRPRRRPGLAAWPDPARPLGREPARERRDLAAGRIRRLRPLDEPAGDRGRRRRADGRAPSGRSRAGDVRERIGARGADRRDRDPGTRLSPVHRAPRRATWRGPVDHVGSRRAGPGSDPGRPRDDVRRPDRDRARLPRLARPDAGQGTRRPGGARDPAPDRHPGEHPLHVRWRDRHRPRAARRPLARCGGRRHAGRHRHHAVVGRRDRRPGAPQPGTRADVARRPLARRPRSRRSASCSTRSTGRSPGPTRPTRHSPIRGGRGPSSSRCAASTTRCPARSSSAPIARAATPHRSAIGGRRSRSVTRDGRSRSPVPTPSDGRPRSGGAAASDGTSRSPRSRPRPMAVRWAPRRSSTMSAAISGPRRSTTGPAA